MSDENYSIAFNLIAKTNNEFNKNSIKNNENKQKSNNGLALAIGALAIGTAIGGFYKGSKGSLKKPQSEPKLEPRQQPTKPPTGLPEPKPNGNFLPEPERVVFDPNIIKEPKTILTKKILSPEIVMGKFKNKSDTQIKNRQNIPLVNLKEQTSLKKINKEEAVKFKPSEETIKASFPNKALENKKALEAEALKPKALLNPSILKQQAKSIPGNKPFVSMAAIKQENARKKEGFVVVSPNQASLDQIRENLRIREEIRKRTAKKIEEEANKPVLPNPEEIKAKEEFKNTRNNPNEDQ